MQPAAFIPLLAAAEGPGLDVVVWLVAGAIWLVSQLVAAKRNQQRKTQNGRPPAADRRESPGAGSSPAPDELAEIFKRLGADIPATPPPPPRQAQPHVPRPAPARVAYAPPPRKPARVPLPQARVQPEIARRLARAKQEAAEAARQSEAALRAAASDLPHNINFRRDDNESTRTATRNSGLVLPRLHAMALRLSTLPSVPMPAFNQTQHIAPPLRIRLHGRRQLRDAIIAQALLHPPKSQSAM
jgi:type IV secretory pathway VirB10-like protein